MIRPRINTRYRYYGSPVPSSSSNKKLLKLFLAAGLIIAGMVVFAFIFLA